MVSKQTAFVALTLILTLGWTELTQAAPPPGIVCHSSPGCPAFVAELNRDIPPLLRNLAVPGASIASIEDGRIVLLNGYGTRDARGLRRVDARTVFNVQSVSKLVTAVGVMRLVEQGSVSLDEPILRRVKRFTLPPSSFDPEQATLRRLLSHTAGLNGFGYGGWRPGDALPTIEQSLAGRVDGGEPTRLVAAPGTRWDYTNGGYALLQLIVEEVTGTSFEDYMHNVVLHPLGMNASRFAVVDNVRGPLAQSFDEIGEPTPPPRMPELGAAGLFTTAEDMARFALFLMGASTHDRRPVVSAETLRLMMTPVAGTEGNQGLGFAILAGDNAMPDGVDRVGHDGRNRGWSTFFWLSPTRKDALIVLTNSSLGWNLNNQVLAAWQNAKSGRPRPIRRSIAAALVAPFRTGGVPAAEARYWQLKRDHPDDYVFAESELNEMGYALFWKGRAHEAAGIVAINTRAYPQSWNLWDSLDDGLVGAKDHAGAIAAYRRSLAINPGNAHSREAIAKLEAAR